MPVSTNRQRSQDETQAANPDAFNPTIPRSVSRKPEYHVYIHSVSKRDFPIKHFLFPKVTLRGCPEGKRYVTVMSIPEPVLQIAPDEANGGRRVYEESAWRVAIDVLNPNNLTNDPYIKLDPSTFISANCDLVRQGLFPSMNEVPTEQEIARAEKARDEYYRGLTDEALKLESLNKRNDLNELLNNNPDVRIALDYFGIQTSFHKKHTATQACPNCGEQIKQGIAFHVIQGIGVCIIDPERAARAGIEVKRGPGRPKNDMATA